MRLFNILIFRLALALNEQGLKMPILANTLFGPQIYFSQHCEQRNCSLPRFFEWRKVLDQLCPTRAQIKDLCGPVKVFAVAKVSYTLTTCPCFDNLEFDICDTGGLHCLFNTSVIIAVRIRKNLVC